MDCLAIDLGTKTGFAYNRGDTVTAGTWTLGKAAEVSRWGKERLNRRKDPRIERLCDLVTDLGIFDVIVFEDVQFASTTFQAHLWAGLRSSLWLCGLGKHFDAVPVGTLKLFATGNGAANKQAMANALSRQAMFNSFELDDNGVDACWLWLWAQKNLARIGR